MSLEIIYAPQALMGMNQIADYLALQTPRLGLRFLCAVEETCEPGGHARHGWSV